MSLSYGLNGDLLEVVAAGDYTLTDIRDSFRRAISTIPPATSVDTLVDARLSQHNPSGDELRAVAAFAGSLLPRLNGRVALVVSGRMRYGLGRMLEVFGVRHGVEFRVFRGLEDARSWLAQP